MNTVRFSRPADPYHDYGPSKRYPDRIPEVTTTTDDEGNEIIKHGYRLEDLTPPDFVLMSANDLTLQAQVDAGVQLTETRPIMPNIIDAITAGMLGANAIMSNPQTFSPMINE